MAQWTTKGSKRLLDHRPVLLATETDDPLCLSEPQFLDLVDQSGSSRARHISVILAVLDSNRVCV